MKKSYCEVSRRVDVDEEGFLAGVGDEEIEIIAPSIVVVAPSRRACNKLLSGSQELPDVEVNACIESSRISISKPSSP